MILTAAAIASAGWFALLRVAVRRSSEIEPDDELPLTVIVFTATTLLWLIPTIAIMRIGTGEWP